MCCVSYKQHGFIRGVEETCLKGNFVLLDMDYVKHVSVLVIATVLESVTGSHDSSGGQVFARGQGPWRAGLLCGSLHLLSKAECVSSATWPDLTTT